MLQNFFSWLSNLFSRLHRWIDQYGFPVIAVINNDLKYAAEKLANPLADTLVKITPWTWDDKLLVTLRAAIPLAIDELDVLPEQIDNVADKIQAFIDHLAGSSPAYRQAMYLKVGSIIAEKSIPEKVKRYETDTLVQISFDRTVE